MTDIEKRATDFALKEIRCESVDELERLGTEIAKKAFEEIHNDYIRIATEQRGTDIDKACKEFCCSCMRENDRSCICLDNSKCRLYKDFRKAMEE